MASGQSLADLFAEFSRPPDANSATYDIVQGAATPKEQLPVLLYDAATVEYTDFEFFMPANYAGGGVTVDLEFSMVSDTNNAHQVVVGLAFNILTAINIGSALTYTFTDGNTTIQSNAKQSKKLTIVITHANIGSPAAGNRMIVRVRRNATSGTDDATGDMRLHGLHIKET